MIRIVKLSGKLYGKEIGIENLDDTDDIQTFTSEGKPVILVENLEDLEVLGIKADEVIMVEKE